MLLDVKGLRKLEIPFSGGVDEASSVTNIGLEDCLELSNMRISKDGKRVEERGGTADQSLTEGEDIYGYHTYYDSSDNFCQLLLLESQIKRKVGSGSWASIHTFSSSIVHPQKVLEIQGKQFIINEINSRFIHTNGSDYQIGIDAPTTLANVHPEYPTVVENEDCSDISDWNEDENGNTTVGVVDPFQTKSCFRFITSSASGGSYATIDKTASVTPGKRFKIEMDIYFDKFQHASQEYFRFLFYYDSANTFMFSSDGYVLSIDNALAARSGSVGITLAEDTWYNLVFYVDTEDKTVDVYIDSVYYGNYTITTTAAGTPGDMYFYCSGHYVETDVYIDFLKIYNTENSSVPGILRRYAITYARSGNYGNESNPIKSIVGDETQYGSGLNDLTPGGTYTGALGKTIQVQIDGTTPDTIKYSYDGGSTWNATTVPITTTMYLNYGVTLTWGAITGHTLNDYWIFSCQTISVRTALGEQVIFDTIPTSGDGQVDQRKIYRSVAEGAIFFWLTTLNDNSTTAYNEEIPDSALGTEVEEDHDIMPDGKFAVWWDNRLWILVDNILYYSDLENPEAFDTDIRYIDVRRGGEGEEGTHLIDYQDDLYVFKRDCIFIIKRYFDGTYGRFLINNSKGCVAPWSFKKVNNLLMMLTHSGWELYNGKDFYSPVFDLDITRTISTIDTSKYDYISSTHNREHGEVLLSLPDRTGGASACTAVYNYIRNKFYRFSYHKTPSCMVEVRNSSKKTQNYIGTRDGYLVLAESGYQDGGNNITSSIWKGWYDIEKHGIFRLLEIEYELPTDKTLTLNCYYDFDKDVARTYSFTGATPTATNRELRRPIWDKAELGGRAKYFAFQLTNAENIGGELKINKAFIWYAPRITKKKTKGD